MHARTGHFLAVLPLLALGCSSSSSNGPSTVDGSTDTGSNSMEGGGSPEGGGSDGSGSNPDSGGSPDSGVSGANPVDAGGDAADSGGAMLLAGNRLPTGDFITPTAAPGSTFLQLKPGDLPGAPAFLADHAASTLTSPDGKTLLVLTSGYNETNWIPSDAPTQNVVGYEDPKNSGEWVFVYDISSNGAPTQKQVLMLPNSFSGIAFNPSGTQLYVGGGVDDDIHVFGQTASGWAEMTSVDGGVTYPIALGHKTALGLQNGPVSAGLAVTADGSKLVVANYENDSISIVTLATGAVVDLDLRPGKAASSPQSGVAGGEYPFWVLVKGSSTAYVSSLRDHEVDVVNLGTPAVTARVPVGKQPNKMIFNKDQSRLFVANGNDDTVSVIDTTANTVAETVSVVAPTSVLANTGNLKGANPNGLALSPDEKTLYVTDGATNAVSVVQRDPAGATASSVVGLIPTGWYPTAVSTSSDGSYLYVSNAKSIPGPSCKDILTSAWGTVGALDAGGPTTQQDCWNGNQYVWQLETAGLLSAPTPSSSVLAGLTAQVAQNDHFAASTAADTTMAFLKSKIKHVIYIIKENRTFDQILGDLGNGSNGDPTLTMYPQSITPNFHALAKNFVTLDSFLDTGETSGVGWNWTTSAHSTDQIERTQPINYGKGGFTYDWEGTNRNINVGIPSLAGRIAALPLTPNDPDLLPGATDVAASSAPNGGTAYIWDGALASGLTVRNYGAFVDLARYTLSGTPYAALFPARDHYPFMTSHQQAWPAAAALQTLTDLYYRGFDQAYPDYWRYEEWNREFANYVTSGNLPNLEIVRMPHDHTGSFGASNTTAGLGTPLLEVADNDAAVGALVAAVAGSTYAQDTLIFVIEDDAQDGPDHVDAHRSNMFVVGPYVKQGKVISTPYDTINVVRTIEDVLGISRLGLYDALAAPMSDLFDTTLDPTTFKYTATTSGVLSGTGALAVRDMSRINEYYAAIRRGHDAAYWERAMKGQNFAREDDLDVEAYNRALWKGLMGSRPYPTKRSGAKHATSEKPWCAADLTSHT
jgi:YVTN family beta-propeller protein